MRCGAFHGCPLTAYKTSLWPVAASQSDFHAPPLPRRHSPNSTRQRASQPRPSHRQPALSIKRNLFSGQTRHRTTHPGMGMGRASRYDKSTHTGIYFLESSGRTGGMDLKSIRLPGDHWSLIRDVMAWILRGVLSPCTPYFSIQHSVFRRGRVDDWTMTSSFVIDTFFWFWYRFQVLGYSVLHGNFLLAVGGRANRAETK